MSLDLNLNKILIIDFGSQFTQLIVRRIRELGVYSELISHKKIKSHQIKSNTKGIILSGGPLNVYQLNNKMFDKTILNTEDEATANAAQAKLTRSWFTLELCD